MTSNSVTYKLSELGAFKNGANYPKGSYGQGDKIVNVKDLFRGRFVSEENLDELIPNALKDKSIYKTQDKDLLFTRSSLVKSGAGMVAMINEPSEDILFCGFIIRYRIFSDQAYPLYMLYLLRSPTYRRLFTGGSVQTNISNINQETLGNIEVHLPKISDQQKIAKVLSDLDAKIELNNKINAELEAMAKLIYDYWFVQFDFPDANGKPYKSSGGAMVYNAELKREIPKGWEVKTIESLLAKNNRTKKIKSTEYQEKGKYPVIDQSMSFICGYTDDAEALIKTEVPRIIFGDHTRIVKLINFDFARGADGTQVLLSNDERIPQHLFYQSIKLIDLSNYGYARHFKFLKEQLVIVPEHAISQKYENIAKSFFDDVKHNTKQNQHLSSLRDWLLPMLMNGQVRVGA